MDKVKVLQALAVCLELTGTDWTEPAMRTVVRDLERYSTQQVLGALERCRAEVRGRLTLADVIQRLDDGRPGAEEAWAMIPVDEHVSGVWTQEMQRAYGAAAALIERGDTVAARMAFIESYRKLTALARARNEPVNWQPTLGWEPGGREYAQSKAAELNAQAKALSVDSLESIEDRAAKV